MIKSLIAFTFDFHVWVGISKDSGISKQAEPETCRQKYINAVSGRRISIYYSKKRMSHPKQAKAQQSLRRSVQMGS